MVSPLVSLMQDQVEALERVAPGRVALVNAQQDARDQPARGRARGRRAACGCSTSRRSASPRPGFLERIRQARDRPVRGRRGALRVPVGARLPAGLLPAGRRGALARRARRSWRRPRRRRRRWRRTSCARLGLREPVRVATGFDRPNLSFAVVPCATKEAVAPRDRRGARASPARCRRSSTPARARSATGCRSGSARELGVEVIAYHAGLPRERARRGAAALHGGRGAGRRRHQRVRHGRRQGRRADGLPRVRAGVDRGLLPGGRPRGARRPAGALPAVRDGRATRACTCSSSSARRSARTLLKAVARAIVRSADGRRRRASTLPRSTSSARIAGGDEEAVRAIVGHLARAGVVQPAPSAPDRVAGRRGRRVGRPRARALPARRRRRARASRWRQYRSVWAWVEGDAVPARGHPAPLRRPLGARADRARAATSAIPRSRPRRRAGAPRAAAGPRQLAQRPVAAGDVGARRGDPRGRRARRSRRSAARARVEVLRGGRSKVIDEALLRRPAALRRLRRTCAPTTVLERVDALLEAGTLRSTGGRFPKLEVAA